MTDPVAVPGGAGDSDTGGGTGGRARRSRLVIALLILLLLLLCVLATVADVYVTRTPDQVAFVKRNVECLKCHAELIPEGKKASVHNPFLLKDCRTCHTPHGYEILKKTTKGKTLTWQRLKTALEWLPLRLACSAYQSPEGLAKIDKGGEVTSAGKREKGATSQFTQDPTEMCWTCHGDLGPLRNAAYQHAPFQNGHCTNCHDPHASDFKALLRQDPRDLCKTCHPMGLELSRAQTHPPVAGWYCTNCHQPHASEWRGILVRRQRELCFECHPTVAPLSLKSVQHNPFVYDNCTGCHEPHGADVRPLLVEKQPSLCYRCHPTIKNDFVKRSHHPVGSVRLNCADCHNPHAADYPALLTARDNAFCYRCHARQIRATYEQSKHQGKLCIRCHTPHGSDWGPLLRNSNPDLCVECHLGYEVRDSHPVRPRFYDVHSNKPLTCTSTCHNPHGTIRPRMLNYPLHQDAICKACHPGVGKFF